MKTVFESERIRFVRVDEVLVPDYLEMVNDMEGVQRFLSHDRRTYTAEKEIAWVRRKREEGAVLFSMIERETGDFIGNIELMDIQDGSAELGITITAKQQDKHFGTEAIRRLLDYGFGELGLEEIKLKVFDFNPRGLHVYLNCGFQIVQIVGDDIHMRIKKE